MAITRRVIEGERRSWSHEIDAGRFKAGILIRQKKCVNAAPQLHSMIGLREDKVKETCSMRGWHMESLSIKK